MIFRISKPDGKDSCMVQSRSNDEMDDQEDDKENDEMGTEVCKDIYDRINDKTITHMRRWMTRTR